jgi:hypothetical protein
MRPLSEDVIKSFNPLSPLMLYNRLRPFESRILCPYSRVGTQDIPFFDLRTAPYPILLLVGNHL